MLSAGRYASTLVVLLICGGSGSAAWAQPAGAPPVRDVFIEPSVTLGVTASTNSRFEPGTAARDDTELSAATSLVVRARRARVQIDGRLNVQAVHYTQHTQSDRLLPDGNLRLNAELAERLLFLDTAFLAQQTSRDVLLGPPAEGSTANTVTLYQVRVAPYIERALDAETTLRARSDHSWVRSSGQGADTASDGHVADHRLSVERRPLPFGWGFDVRQGETRYRDQRDPALLTRTARVTGRLLLREQFQFGLVAGRDRIETLTSSDSTTLYGLEAAWKPDERTDFSARGEHRAFGMGWEGRFVHRTPSWAFNVRTLREPSTYASSLGTVPAGASVASLVDAVLTTRIPDPVERARAVEDFIARQGLPREMAQAQAVQSTAARLARNTSASLMFTGVRNTVTLSAFVGEVAPLRLGDVSDLLVQGTTTRQAGAGIEWSYRLLPLTTWTLGARWGHNEVTSDVGTEQSRELAISTLLTAQLGARSSGSIGLRQRVLRPGAGSTTRETALIAGITRRF